jgi:hypothetical protein
MTSLLVLIVSRYERALNFVDMYSKLEFVKIQYRFNWVRISGTF